jgi:tetratricopeptide (TPR) repeat protein
MLLFLFLSGCSSLANFQHHKEQESKHLSQLAEFAEEKKEFEQAAEFWEQAAHLCKDESFCLLRCAENHCKNKKYRQASEILTHAVEKNPNDIQVYLNLAEAQLHSGNRMLADKTLQTALNIDPNNTDAMMMLAEIVFLQKRFDIQGDLYHRVLSVAPAHLPAQIALASWYMKNDKDEQAEILFRNILIDQNATPQQIVQAKWNIGILLGKNEKWDDAVVVLSSVIDQKENSTSDDWCRLAYACYQNYQVPECREYLDKSLQLNSTDVSALQLQKKIRSGAGHSIELVEYEEQQPELSPPPYWK